MAPFAKELSAQLTEDSLPLAPSTSIKSSVRIDWRVIDWRELYVN